MFLAAIPVPGRADFTGQHLVARLDVQPQLLAEVAHRGGGVGRGDGLDAGVELPFPGSAGGHGPGDAGVEPAHHAPARAHRLEEESLVADAQVFLFHQGTRQPGQFSQSTRDAPALRRGQARTRMQCSHIVVLHKFFSRAAGGFG